VSALAKLAALVVSGEDANISIFLVVFGGEFLDIPHSAPGRRLRTAESRIFASLSIDRVGLGSQLQKDG